MSESIEFIKDRTAKTLSVAKQLAATWAWQEISVADYAAAYSAAFGDHEVKPPVIGQEEVASRAEQAMLAARGRWDAALDDLHKRTVQGLVMARNRFRNDAAKADQLANLGAQGDSRSKTLEEALAWESAWSSVAPTWAPLPANTLEAFKTLRQQCNEKLRKDYNDAQAEARKQSAKLNELAADLEESNVAWYADATQVFAEGTAEGDLIRSRVPTTYTPPTDKPAPAPTPEPPK